MDTRARRLLMTALVLSTASIANAQPGATAPGDDACGGPCYEAPPEATEATVVTPSADAVIIHPQVNATDEAEASANVYVAAPGMVRATQGEPTRIYERKRSSLIATDARWGGGVRVTGLSGIGALPGVNYGAEVAGYIRHDEWFGELGFGWWRPEDNIVVRDGNQYTDLNLKLWSARGGWAAMHVPLRAWVLVEAGEVAGAKGMPLVMARMVSGDMPQANRWQAMGAGFGVAWPMAHSARLFGMVEFAVPMNRGELMTDSGQFQPDPLAARSSVGLELGWR